MPVFCVKFFCNYENPVYNLIAPSGCCSYYRKPHDLKLTLLLVNIQFRYVLYFLWTLSSLFIILLWTFSGLFYIWSFFVQWKTSCKILSKEVYIWKSKCWVILLRAGSLNHFSGEADRGEQNFSQSQRGIS